MSAILGKMDKFFKHDGVIVNTQSRVYDKVNQYDRSSTGRSKRIIVGLKTAGALLASPFLAVAVMVDKVVQDVQFAVQYGNRKGAKKAIALRMALMLPLAIGMGLFYLPQGAIQQVRNAINVCKTKSEFKSEVESKLESEVDPELKSEFKSETESKVESEVESE